MKDRTETLRELLEAYRRGEESAEVLIERAYDAGFRYHFDEPLERYRKETAAAAARLVHAWITRAAAREVDAPEDVAAARTLARVRGALDSLLPSSEWKP